MNTRIAAAVTAAGLLVLGGCGNAPSSSPVRTVGDDGTSAYDEIVMAVEKANVPVCSSDDGQRFLALVAPAVEAARDYSYFRYLDGRIYEFGPCQLAAGRRNEVRVYRYATSDARDAGVRDAAKRGTRPTATWALRDVWGVEIWSPDPSPDSPAGQVAGQVHTAIGRLPQARHLDLVPVGA